MAKTPFLSVVVPVYNEHARLHHLSKISRYLAKVPFTSELLVVDDGSSDATPTLLLQLQQQFPIKVITSAVNRGKGHAVKQGMLHAKGQWRVFMDVDLSVPLPTIKQLVEQLQTDADIVIGTRRRRESQVLVRQPFWREYFGKAFTFFSQRWLGLTTSDFTCGFKCFSQESSQRIFSQMHIERWGFDTESLFIAQKLGFAVLEMPVHWKNDPKTRVKFPQDLLRSLLDLFEIKYHSWRGRYR